MADSKISALSAVTVVGATDEAVLAIGGATKKITGANLKTAMNPAPTSVNGQAGIIVPSALGWIGLASGGFTANRIAISRFVAPKDFTVTSVKFRTNTAGTGNVDVGIYDAAGTTKLKSSGSTASKKGANTTQTVALTSTLAITAGTIYHVALESDVSDGTYTAAWFTAITDQIFGTGLGVAETFLFDSTFPLPASLSGAAATGASGPVFALI